MKQINELSTLPRLELIYEMELMLDDLWELANQYGDENIMKKISELSAELSSIRDAEEDSA